MQSSPASRGQGEPLAVLQCAAALGATLTALDRAVRSLVVAAPSTPSSPAPADALRSPGDSVVLRAAAEDRAEAAAVLAAAIARAEAAEKALDAARQEASVAREAAEAAEAARQAESSRADELARRVTGLEEAAAEEASAASQAGSLAVLLGERARALLPALDAALARRRRAGPPGAQETPGRALEESPGRALEESPPSSPDALGLGAEFTTPRVYSPLRRLPEE